MKLFTLQRGTVQTGMTLRLLGQALKEQEQREQSATLESLAGTAFVAWTDAKGEGTLSVSTPGQALQTFQAPPTNKKGEPTIVVAPLPAVIRYAFENEPGLTLNIARSGAYTVVRGAEADPLPVLPTPANASALEAAAHDWLRNGQIGSSSYALCVGLTGVTSPTENGSNLSATPQDSADLGRCLAFFEAVPEARAKLEHMREKGPTWSALVTVWPELEALQSVKDYKAVNALIDSATLAAESTPKRPKPGR